MTGPAGDALARLGRTEDARFSPNNRLLALAGFGQHTCLFLRFKVEAAQGRPAFIVDDFMTVTSPEIGSVHGLDFLDDRTIVVANRGASVAVFELPPGDPVGRHHHLQPVHVIRPGPGSGVKSPGSVVAYRRTRREAHVLVCNNKGDSVTRHVIARRGQSWTSRRSGRLLGGLRIPDGVAVSHDGRWIAVSSHGTHDVRIFRARSWPIPHTRLVGVLRGVLYPHGLRFTHNDRHIIVADAGGPFVHVFQGDGDWRGARTPAHSVRVMPDDAFDRGRIRPDGSVNEQEGGPKGLDIDDPGTVLVTTCEEQPLAVFLLSSIVGVGMEPGGQGTQTGVNASRRSYDGVSWLH